MATQSTAEQDITTFARPILEDRFHNQKVAISTQNSVDPLPLQPHRTATPIQLRHPEHCKNPSHSRVAFSFVNKHDPYYNPPGVDVGQLPVNQESLFYLCVPLVRVLMFYFCPVLLILCSNPAFHT